MYYFKLVYISWFWLWILHNLKYICKLSTECLRQNMLLDEQYAVIINFCLLIYKGYVKLPINSFVLKSHRLNFDHSCAHIFAMKFWTTLVNVPWPTILVRMAALIFLMYVTSEVPIGNSYICTHLDNGRLLNSEIWDV